MGDSKMISPSKYYQKDLAEFLNKIMPASDNCVVLNNSLAYTEDAQKDIRKIFKEIDNGSRIVVISFNFLWKPLLNLASKIGLRKKDILEPNWLSKSDIKNFFYLEGFEEIREGTRFIFPIDLGFISIFFNKFIGNLPIINSFGLTNYQVFRKVPKRKNYSVSIIIPARNEAKNIEGILKKIPHLNKKMEVIFIEGHSQDQTFETIKMEIEKYKGPFRIRLIKQRGIGKGDAVRLGLKKAKNEFLIILDADLSVEPNKLKKFYKAICLGKADLANGSRLIYPLPDQAMRTLNYLGNKIFGSIFTYLLDQQVKDTLCGTKAILKKNYQQIEKNRSFFGNFDPFGDFDLLFGAARLNLKITDIPIRYHERKYGKTNINRFTHGFLLLKMTLIASHKLKFI